MNRNDLLEMRFNVRQVQKRAYKAQSCLIKGCDNCDCAYICELTKCLLKFIRHELNKYDVKGELKDDND